MSTIKLPSQKTQINVVTPTSASARQYVAHVRCEPFEPETLEEWKAECSYFKQKYEEQDRLRQDYADRIERVQSLKFSFSYDEHCLQDQLSHWIKPELDEEILEEVYDTFVDEYEDDVLDKFHEVIEDKVGDFAMENKKWILNLNLNAIIKKIKGLQWDSSRNSYIRIHDNEAEEKKVEVIEEDLASKYLITRLRLKELQCDPKPLETEKEEDDE